MSKNIYIICPDNHTPSGGVRKLYDHVDILNAAGFKSFLVHETKNFSSPWFKKSTPVTHLSAIKPSTKDVLVIPEIYGYNIINIWPGIKKVIINLNAYNTFKGFSLNLEYTKEVYQHVDVLGVLVNSLHDYKYLRDIFPQTNIYRIYNGIDEAIFSYEDNKENIVSYMPRKLPQEAEHLINLLKIRNKCGSYKFQLIDNMTLYDYANTLKKSIIFLSFSHNEGFGLPPVEAMACGCIVIGFHGNGGKEFFKESTSFPVESNDILSFAQKTEQVIAEFSTNPKRLNSIRKRASELIFEEYSIEKEKNGILDFWNNLNK